MTGGRCLVIRMNARCPKVSFSSLDVVQGGGNGKPTDLVSKEMWRFKAGSWRR
jgi:hypothetical protein